MEKQMIDRRRVGSYICWDCHKEFSLYEGERRRYCPECVLTRQKSLAGRRIQPSRAGKEARPK